MRLKKDIDKNKWFEGRLLEVLGSEYKRIGNYIDTDTDIEIEHIPCGRVFTSKPYNLLQGYGCSKCSGKMKKDTEIFKKEVYNLVGNEYTVIGEYVNASTPILIKHNKCGTTYPVIAKNFTSPSLKRRCKHCSGLEKKTKQEIQDYLDERYPCEFKVIGEYVNKDTPIDVLHIPCGTIITPTWNNIRSAKFGCKNCKMSSGELEVSLILKSLNLEYTMQKKFKGCKDKRYLPFDFYLNINDQEFIIEYDGRQHYLPIFGKNDKERKENFEKTKKHDEIKNKYCEDNNIKLLRIKYDQTDIKSLIENFLN